MKAFSRSLIVGAMAVSCPLSAESVAPLVWTTCSAVGGTPTDVALRTECATLAVPRDYAHPSAGTLNLDVIRVTAKAGRGERHDGTLFLEPDEFGAPLTEAIPAVASRWLEGDDHWRNVSNRLDLVGLAQRRMKGGGGHDCVAAASTIPRPGIDLTEGDAAAAGSLALAVATACQNDPMASHIGTSPRIEDIERLRDALGRNTLHLLGAGRGGWVLARYAERHPDRVGRMLLDGSWDVDGSVAEAMELRISERGRAFRRAIAALRDAPDRYDWRIEAADIHARFARLPAPLRAAWSPSIVDAPHLAAALAMARGIDAGVAPEPAALHGHLTATRLAATEADDRAVRKAGSALIAALGGANDLDAYGFGARANDAGTAALATAFAARCNDGYWGRSPRYWHDRARELRELWPSTTGEELFQGQVCSQWPGVFGPSGVPVLTRPFLMVHAEYDAEAPLRGAALTLQTHDKARLVVARGLVAHEVSLHPEAACVSAAAGRYLADGVLPDAMVTNCVQGAE